MVNQFTFELHPRDQSAVPIFVNFPVPEFANGQRNSNQRQTLPTHRHNETPSLKLA